MLMWWLLVGVSGFRSQLVRVCGVKHHVRDTGEVDPEGPIAVLLHGFAGSTESWDLVAARLAGSGCRAIAIDRVGFGRTERPVVPTLPLPALPFGDKLAAALEALEADSAEQSAPSGNGGLSLPEPRKALAMGLRNPSALAPRLPWSLSAQAKGENPYSSSFAVSKALWPLIRERVGPATALESGARPRRIYLVGHSAGGGLAIRALAECGGLGPSPLPLGTCLAGVALIAPAALDPKEDADAFDESDEPGLLADAPLPPSVRRRAELELRIAAFRTIVGLPNAFGLQTARRIYTGRDIAEAVLGQMHPRMRDPAFSARVDALVSKYAAPVVDFPETWDQALLEVQTMSSRHSGLTSPLPLHSSLTHHPHLSPCTPHPSPSPSPLTSHPSTPPVTLTQVYRADLEPSERAKGLRGRKLLAAAREAAQRLNGVPVLVATGDSDTVVTPRASRRVAELLGLGEGDLVRFETLSETGHLPMDERPKRTAEALLDFFETRQTSCDVRAASLDARRPRIELDAFVASAQRALLHPPLRASSDSAVAVAADEVQAAAAAAVAAAAAAAAPTAEDERLRVEVRTCDSLDAFLRSRPTLEVCDSGGGVRAVVFAFVEPPWRRAEHVSTGGAPLLFEREPALAFAPSPDEPPPADDSGSRCQGPGTRDQGPGARDEPPAADAACVALSGDAPPLQSSELQQLEGRLHAAPTLALKLIRREALEELLAGGGRRRRGGGGRRRRRWKRR